MYQRVIVTRCADRHGELHERDYAESNEYTVYSGNLSQVLRQLADAVEGPLGGRFIIEIDWSHE